MQHVPEMCVEITKLERLDGMLAVARMPKAPTAAAEVAAHMVLASITPMQVANAQQGLTAPAIFPGAVYREKMRRGRDPSRSQVALERADTFVDY